MNHGKANTPVRSKTATLGRDIGLAAMATGLVTALWLAGWLAPLDRSIGDVLLRLTHRSEGDAPVVAIVIDDDAISAHQSLPWPRSTIAEIVAAAHRAGAAAVALDVLLVEPGVSSGDRELSQALDEGPSLLAAALGPDGGWLLPHSRFGGPDRAAHVHFEIGPDGVARTLLTTKQDPELSLPALSLSAARVLRPELVIAAGALLRPDFRPGPTRVQQVAVTEFLSSPDRERWVKGRLVFVGITATGSGDRLVVPTAPGPAPSPGVLVHASAAASILGNGLIHRLGGVWVLFVTFLVALAPQIQRTRSGAFQPWAMMVIVIVIFVVASLFLEFRHLLVPTPILVVGMVLSFVLREGDESRIAQRESGELLQSLLRHHDRNEEASVPRSSIGRLAALRTLQAAVLRQDAARRTLLEGMKDGVVMWDSGGRTAVINPAATRLWGGEPGFSDFQNVVSDQDEGEPVVFQRQGREIAVAVFPLGDGGMALLRDVTAERDLERKRRDMQRLVSHELKTPLASIAGFGETLQRYEMTRDEQHRVATLIRGESLRLGEMVATFLDLERLDSRQVAEAMETIDLGALVEQRLEILSEAAHRRTQEIVADVEADVMVRASTTLLERVVDNLVGNAVKYSAEGGKIEVAVNREPPNAVLTVTDHGVGIPEDALPRLFERFYRVPGVQGSGSGLGLAVANEVVTWHGGCIGVESRIGRGSTFSVRLPAEA